MSTNLVEAEYIQNGEAILRDGVAVKVMDVRRVLDDNDLTLTYKVAGFTVEEMVHPRDLVEVL